MKNQIQKLKTKLTGRGSILVYTLIVMMIMLSTALSIFAVAVREKKGAGLTAASLQAFAVADSGSEIALQAADRGTAINSLPGATSCNSTTGTVTINVAGGIADITFYSDETATTALGCTVSAGSAQKVKSVGKYGGTARAVEVAVASGNCRGGVTKIAWKDGSAAFTQSQLDDLENFILNGDGRIVNTVCRTSADNLIFLNGIVGNVMTTATVKTFAMFDPTVGAFVCSVSEGSKCYQSSSGSLCSSGWAVYGSCTCDNNECSI